MRTIIAFMTVVVLLAAGCGGGSHAPGLAVVASTNVYGDIARQIGGAHVDVTSILTDPTADPHLFEPGTASGLAVARADVLIENGVGYDDFMHKLADATPRDGRIVVDAGDVLGVHGRDANPHLWYDLPRMPRVARAIADAFVRADEAHAAAYRAGLTRFTTSLALLARVHVQQARPVAYTEPVPGYLLDAVHVRNVAPAAFTRAIENGTEPPPSALSDMEALIREHRVGALLYNGQAVSPITQRLRELAESNHIPVVGVTETLPPHRTYQQWMLGELRALRDALAR